ALVGCTRQRRLLLRFLAAPPVRLLTVAQAIRSAVLVERPRRLELFWIFDAMRVCLLEWLFLDPRGMGEPPFAPIRCTSCAVPSALTASRAGDAGTSSRASPTTAGGRGMRAR